MLSRATVLFPWSSSMSRQYMSRTSWLSERSTPHLRHSLDHAAEVLLEQGHRTHRTDLLQVAIENPRGIDLQDFAARAPGLQDIDENVEVEPGSFPVGERLRQGGEMHGHHDLVGHLGVHP